MNSRASMGNHRQVPANAVHYRATRNGATTEAEASTRTYGLCALADVAAAAVDTTPPEVLGRDGPVDDERAGPPLLAP